MKEVTVARGIQAAGHNLQAEAPPPKVETMAALSMPQTGLPHLAEQ